MKENKIIAEFMGYETYEGVDKVCINLTENNGFSSDWGHVPMKYHSSWDWLMPVVHNCTKIIENYGYDSDARNYFEDEIFNLDNTLSEFLNNDIESVYARVVEFIKYYNETK